MQVFFLLVMSVLLIISCKTTVKDEKAETKDLQSDSGQILTVAFSSHSTHKPPEKDLRYCVLWTSGKQVKLLTPDGGLRQGQLRRALRSLDIEWQIALVAMGPAGFFLGPLGVLTIPATIIAVTMDAALGVTRAKDIMDDRKVVRISDKVMARSIYRIRKEKTDMFGSCDHLLKWMKDKQTQD